MKKIMLRIAIFLDLLFACVCGYESFKSGYEGNLQGVFASPQGLFAGYQGFLEAGVTGAILIAILWYLCLLIVDITKFICDKKRS